ncbi:MAG: alkaline phosphatase [Gemmatimonadetes bacterium]|jgi:3',5'-cyclic AMP phosphodiesterase CpdA|nr:alkaline phosphatase [Gemmatimonadota bacterium]
MAERLRRLRFGLCADVHKDIMHDADERLRVFVERMKQEKVDFVLQLGDFCRPYDYNRSFMEVWESFPGPRFHVHGNHDIDGGFTREQTMEYWSMPARYYSADLSGYHLVVLDGNEEREGRPPGYPHYIGPEQLEWLRADLAETEKPTFVFSHQSLESLAEPEQGVENADEARAVLEEANREAGWLKVAVCFSGHDHTDSHNCIDGIHYVQINSMSNYWMGDEYQQIRYGEEVDREFPWIKYTAPYRDSLYALVAVEPDGRIGIEGVKSAFVGSSPWDLDYPHRQVEERIVPTIRSREFSISPEVG